MPMPEGMRLNLGDVEPANFYVTPSSNGKSDPIRLTLDATLETAGDARPVLPAAPGFLKAAADLATDFGRVQDLGDLKQLIARAAALTEASGVVVWLGNSQGGRSPASPHARLQSGRRHASRAGASIREQRRRGGLPQAGRFRWCRRSRFRAERLSRRSSGPKGCIGALIGPSFRGAEASEAGPGRSPRLSRHTWPVVLGASPSEVTQSRTAAAS
jgi:hypothetical protein